MKKIIGMGLPLLLLAVLSSCKEEPIGQYPIDDVPPGAVENPRVVKQFGGGVTVEYNIPDDDDLLYVKATYVLNTGVQTEVTSSLYKNRLDIVGYSREGDYEVELRAVDRSRNESEPVSITVRPYDSPIHEIIRNLRAFDDFGGIQVQWDNPEKFDVTIMVSKPMQEGSDMTEPVTTFYSNSAQGVGYVRGYPPEEQVFMIQLQDRWGNLTEEKSDTYLPLYEEEINKKRFSTWKGDSGIVWTDYNTSSWAQNKLWDGGLSQGFHTKGGTTPKSDKCTFDMGAVYTLSRFKIWQRGQSSANLKYLYSQGNVRRFTLYGSPHPNAKIAYDDSDDPEVQEFKWIKLGYFEVIKPSGSPIGTNTDEDIQVAATDGHDFTVPIENSVPVRYLRLDVHETWDGNNDAFYIMEMTLWGQPAN